MTVLGSCVLVVVITFCVTLFALVVMQKLFDEQKKQSNEAVRALGKLWENFGQTAVGVANEIMKMDAERKEKERKEAEQRNYERMTRTEYDV